MGVAGHTEAILVRSQPRTDPSPSTECRFKELISPGFFAKMVQLQPKEPDGALRAKRA